MSLCKILFYLVKFSAHYVPTCKPQFKLNGKTTKLYWIIYSAVEADAAISNQANGFHGLWAYITKIVNCTLCLWILSLKLLCTTNFYIWLFNAEAAEKLLQGPAKTKCQIMIWTRSGKTTETSWPSHLSNSSHRQLFTILRYRKKWTVCIAQEDAIWARNCIGTIFPQCWHSHSALPQPSHSWEALCIYFRRDRNSCL